MCDWSAPLTEWGAEETAARFSRTHRGSRNLFPRKVLCFNARRDARAARCWQPLRRAPSISTTSAKPFKIRCKRPSQLLTKRDELHRNRNELGAVKWPHCLLSRLQDLVFVLILFLMLKLVSFNLLTLQVQFKKKKLRNNSHRSLLPPLTFSFLYLKKHIFVCISVFCARKSKWT